MWRGTTRSTPVSIKLTEKKSVLYDAGDVNLDYGLYVPVSALERLHDLTVTGDGGARTVAVRETGDTLACTNGSSLVYINGTPVRLDSPSSSRRTTATCPPKR